MLILVFGGNWFGIPYDNSDPLYIPDDDEWIANAQAEDPVKWADI